MIIDKISNAYLYYGLGAGFETALRETEALAAQPVPTAPFKKELDGRNVYYSIQFVKGKLPDPEAYEAHSHYADIQAVLGGTEYMGWANVKDLHVNTPYSEEHDAGFYGGDGTMLRVPAGWFVIFFPEDAHMPCRCIESDPCSSVKLVAKIKVN